MASTGLPNLPSPRTLLTSLLNNLFKENSPFVNQPPDATSIQPGGTPETPLGQLPPSHRTLLTTLHVLFPPPILLQSLDILDRGLVTKITEHRALSPRREKEREGETTTSHAKVYIRAALQVAADSLKLSAEGKDGGRACSLFQVHSSKPKKSRFRDPTGTESMDVYVVHLEAWQCSCAAFAFSAFPPSAPSVPLWSGTHLTSNDGWETNIRNMGHVEADEEESNWSFGGFSRDGGDGEGNVPVCKHLLACLLGEKWTTLEGYIAKRPVSIDEMAGLGGH